MPLTNSKDCEGCRLVLYIEAMNHSMRLELPSWKDKRSYYIFHEGCDLPPELVLSEG